jgi:TolB protein
MDPRFREGDGFFAMTYFEIGSSLKLKLAVFFLLFAVCCLLSNFAQARVYIDITSPAFTKLPIAIQDFTGPYGDEISEIITADLDYTGLFFCVDKDAHLEKPGQSFNPGNWTLLGVETVVKGSIVEGKELVVTVSLHDVLEKKEILRKEYRADKALMRPLSHTIANDIYHALTGEKGIFRSRIAFVADDKGEKAIYLMDWDGRRASNTGMKGNVVLSPHWSKDGTKLLYSSERNRQWGVYLLDFITMTEKRVFSSKGTNIAGDFLGDGQEFLISSSKGGTPDIFIINPLKNSAVKLTSSYGIDVSPSVSPDSQQIAFVSDRGGSPQVYKMRKDGSDVRRITFEGSYNTSPAWSPKGDKIVFSGRRGGNQIFVVNPDGSELFQLTSQGNNEDPSFSPDGRYIVFTSDREGMKAVYIMRANGEAQRRITPKNMKAFNPRWSPN